MAETVKPKYDLFISYAHQDAAYVNQLATALRQESLRVWHDQGLLRMGEEFLAGMQQALEESRFFLLVISPDYLASQWTNFEMGVALSRRQPLIPLYLRPVDQAALPASIHRLTGLSAQDVSPKQVAHLLAKTIKQPAKLKRAS
jgi:hypothetical protein